MAIVQNHPPAHAPAPDTTTRRLVTVGALAGPILLLTWWWQALTREGYDVTRHPMSLLALGPGGAVQVASFVVTGILVLVLAVGYQRVYDCGAGSTWLPRLVASCGLGLVGAGVFRTDPGAGFPAGAPPGVPDYTTVGIAHEVSFVLVMVSWSAAMVVLLRRAHQTADRALRDAVAVCLVLVLLVSLVPHLDSFPVRTVLAGAAQLAFLAAVPLRDCWRDRAGVTGARAPAAPRGRRS